MHERLKNLRQAICPRSAAEFADGLGMEYRTYASYERGERKPSAELIKKLVLEYKVNASWLFTGHGPMFLPAKNKKLEKYEQAFKERKTFGKRLNYYQLEENLMDDEIAKIIDSSESRVEKLGLDKTEPTLAELRALKKYSGIPLDLWVDGETMCEQSVTQMLSQEEQKMLEFLKKAKENKLI